MSFVAQQPLLAFERLIEVFWGIKAQLLRLIRASRVRSQRDLVAQLPASACAIEFCQHAAVSKLLVTSRAHRHMQLTAFHVHHACWRSWAH